jgi:DNA-binding Xre family transcriptional regulator
MLGRIGGRGSAKRKKAIIKQRTEFQRKVEGLSNIELNNLREALAREKADLENRTKVSKETLDSMLEGKDKQIIRKKLNEIEDRHIKVLSAICDIMRETVKRHRPV